jgi:hypothetical protein
LQPPFRQTQKIKKAATPEEAAADVQHRWKESIFSHPAKGVRNLKQIKLVAFCAEIGSGIASF